MIRKNENREQRIENGKNKSKNIYPRPSRTRVHKPQITRIIKSMKSK